MKHKRIGCLLLSLLLLAGCSQGTPNKPDETKADTQTQAASEAQTNKTEITTEEETEEKPPQKTECCLYVSPNGSSDGDGSAEAPYKDIQTAVNNLPTQGDPLPCEIILMDGDYYLTESIRIGGGAQEPLYPSLTIRAQNSGRVRLIGGISVESSLCQPVTDRAILDRVIDKTAAGKLMMLDLNGLVNTFPMVSLYNPTEIFLDDQALVFSRWPNDVRNEGYLRAESVVSVGQTPKDQPMTFTYADPTNRASQWSEAGKQDLYILSYLGVDWLNDMLKVTELDAAAKTVTTENGGTYGATAGNRFFFFNLLEEIDVPGESYVDREAGIVYYYPFADNTKEIMISTMSDSLLVLKGGANITIEGLSFGYTRGRAIEASDMTALTIKNCQIYNTGDAAMGLSGSRIVVDGCEIRDTWGGGISMGGGGLKNLVSSENVIQNCEIHDVNRGMATYKPGIWAESVGIVIRNNTFYHAVHQMIKVYTNDAVITQNEFHHCVTDSSDMGVIYFGRDPSQMGTVISYNYFHDNGNTYGGIGQFAVYIDDGGAGAHIHHNLFHEAVPQDSAIRLHGSQHSLIEYNLFSKMDSAVFNAHWPGHAPDSVKQYEWLLWMYDLAPNRQHGIRERIEATGMDSDVWREHYRDTIWAPMFNYLTEDVKKIVKEHEAGRVSKVDKILNLNAPITSNEMSDNIFIHIDLYDESVQAGGALYADGILRGGSTKCERNMLVSEEDFVEYGKNFALTEAGLAKVQEKIPGFENFDMEQIGPKTRS